MKICHFLTSSSFAGIEQHVAELAYIQNIDHEVTILCNEEIIDNYKEFNVIKISNFSRRSLFGIFKIYQILNMTGLTRSEFIIQDGIPYFLEINTNPGLSKESIIPKQLKEHGMSLTDFFDILIQNALG